MNDYAMRYEKPLVLGCLVLYVVFAVCLANVRPPQSDEGHFAEGAAEIATSGHFITPTWTEWLPTLNQRVYAVMPLYFYALAGWFRAFGVAMLSMRYFSVLWGVVLVFSYYVLMRHISKDRLMACLALLFMVLNYDLINLTTARYDDMAAALSAAGLATYASLRERNLGLAILFANVCIAAAAMTHPYGAFGFPCLIILFWALDRDRFRMNYLVLGAVPYVIALLGWGLYIAQDVAMFKAQFGSNATAHKASLLHPLSLLAGELHDRYWVLFAGERSGVPVYMRVKLGLLLLYIVSFVSCLLMPEVRRDKAASAFLACAAFGFFALTVVEGSHLYIYLVHVIGLYSLVVAIWLSRMMRLGRWQRSVAILALCCLAIFTVASLGYRVKLNSYRNAFVPAADYLRQRLVDKQLVFAGGEFAIPLGFADHVLDDPHLGYRSHRLADYIVVGKDYDAKFRREKARHPDVYLYLMNTLQTYRVVFESKAGFDYYRVYARPDLVGEQVHAEAAAPAVH